MSLLAFFSLSTGRVQEPGPRVECTPRISMFIICQIFFNFVRFFFHFVRIFIFRKVGTLQEPENGFGRQADDVDSSHE
jgi:hypothetical protein